MTLTDNYIFFYGGNCIYSNFTLHNLFVDGNHFTCVEQYYQFKKAMHFADTKTAIAIMLAGLNPHKQKKLGQQVNGFDKTEWHKHAYDVMYKGVLCKFDNDEAFRRELLVTGNRQFVEASPTDLVWGVGLAEHDPNIHNPENWLGTNWLGQIITQVRAAIRANNQ